MTTQNAPMMSYDGNPPDVALQFRRILSVKKDKRTSQDADIIYGHLRSIQAISKLPESAIRQMAKHAHYEVHESNETMYKSGDVATCCYILLSGSVYLNGYLYLPGSCFGQQNNTGKRLADCLILERSEMIVIGYPKVQSSTEYYHREIFEEAYEECYETVIHENSNFPINKLSDIHQVKEILQKSEPYLDVLGKVEKNKKNRDKSPQPKKQQKTSLDNLEWDLSAMKENIEVPLDSDDEEDTNDGSAVVQDIVRDCLEKEPIERTENDINTLMNFIQHLPAFTKLSHNIKVEMCKVMVFAVVDKAGAIVMSDNEEMDSWSVILNGSVDVFLKNKPPKTLTLGDAFGVSTTPGVMYHQGMMKTRVDDCQFVCIAQDDYWRIFSQGEASCRKVEEEGEVVMVTEHRVVDGGSRQGQVVIKGTPERLLDHLMEDHSVIDPTYVEDFLLTFVVFFNKAHEIIKKLIKWFDRPQLQDKVTRVMLLWVNNHFCDFEGDSYMESSLERFEYMLELKKMVGQLRLLNMACSAKSKPRIITLQRITKDSKLDFSICGGRDRASPIFVSQVNYDSKAYELGLKRGDQILECNGQSFENISFQKAIDLLTYHTHICLIVKSNTMGFKETSQQYNKKRVSQNHSLDETTLSSQLSALDLISAKKGTSVNRSASDVHHTKAGKQLSNSRLDIPDHANTNGSMTLPRSNKFRKAMMKLNFMPRATSNNELNKMDPQADIRPFNRPPDRTNNSDDRSFNPNEDTMDLNSQVIKVYRGDHTSRFFVLTKDTIAKEVIATAIEAFGITDMSKVYFLCEVTVTEDGLIKQKRLPDVANNLASRISLNGRYYIKTSISDTPISDDVAQEIAREANLTLLQLSPLDIAKELTLQDFELFRHVDSREYIYNLFEDKNERKSKNLRCVEQTTNKEMFWVINEIVSEDNITRRVKLIKYFLKVAKLCKDFKNYNSMYAIISGLANSSVSRLKGTWERVPQKSDKLFNDLQDLMDPSRNMSKYRNLFTGEKCYPPLIPWFPIVKKDITFLHLGNDTKIEGLINFEKLRMISREVRKICKYCNIGYDPYKMDALEENQGEANVALSVVSMTNDFKMKRNGRSLLAMNNPKKAYDEFQTTRRIKQYLETMSAQQYSEKELQEMSYNCEPPATVNAPVGPRAPIPRASPTISSNVPVKKEPSPPVKNKEPPLPLKNKESLPTVRNKELSVKSKEPLAPVKDMTPSLPVKNKEPSPPIKNKEPSVKSKEPGAPQKPLPPPPVETSTEQSESDMALAPTKPSRTKKNRSGKSNSSTGDRRHVKKPHAFDDEGQVSMV